MIRYELDVAASVWNVFDIIGHFAYQARAVDGLKDLRFLTDQKEGVGTLVSCRRDLGGDIEQQVIEVAEYEPDGYVRIIAEADGHLWDTRYFIDPARIGAHVSMDIVARPARAGKGEAKEITDAIRAAFSAELDQIKQYCETHRPL